MTNQSNDTFLSSVCELEEPTNVENRQWSEETREVRNLSPASSISLLEDDDHPTIYAVITRLNES